LIFLIDGGYYNVDHAIQYGKPNQMVITLQQTGVKQKLIFFGWVNWSRILSKDYEIKAVYEENAFMLSHLHTLLKRY